MIIGIDPDSKAHGVAIYEKGKLIDLKPMNLVELMGVFRANEHRNPIVHIEDVNGVSASFTARDSKKNTNIKLKIASHSGMCKQAQIEVERMAEYYGIRVVKHKISSAWKDARGKKMFEAATGWKGRSNEDTRSAAYFGMLGCK